MGMTLDEISKLLGEITPADQWSYDGGDNTNASLTIGEMDCDLSRMSRYTHELVASREEMEANARLIAAAPTIIKELVERVRKLEKVNDAAKEVLWGIYGGINNDDFVAEIAIDRATGKRTRAVALYDAIVATLPVPEESVVHARLEGE